MSNALLALIAQRKAASSRSKTVKPDNGRSRWRLLPSWRIPAKAPDHLDEEGKGQWLAQFYIDFGQHFIKDAAGQVKAVYVCVDKTFGRPCSICDEVARGILASQDDLTKKRLEDARAPGRVLFNAQRVDGPNPNEVVLLELPPSAFNGHKGVGGIVSLFTDWPNLVSWDNGADVIIERGGQGKDTRYGVAAVNSLTPAINEAALRPKMFDLDAYIMQENNEGQQRAIASVSAITGLLPMQPRPALTASAAAAFSPAAAPAVAQTFDDIPDFTQAAPNPFVAAPAPAPVVQAPVVQAPVAPAPVVQPVVAAPAVAAPQFTPEMLQAAMAMLMQQQTAGATVAPTATAVVQPPVQAPVAAPVAQPAAAGAQSLEDMLKDL